MVVRQMLGSQRKQGSIARAQKTGSRWPENSIWEAVALARAVPEQRLRLSRMLVHRKLQAMVCVSWILDCWCASARNVTSRSTGTLSAWHNQVHLVGKYRITYSPEDRGRFYRRTFLRR